MQTEELLQKEYQPSQGQCDIASEMHPLSSGETRRDQIIIESSKKISQQERSFTKRAIIVIRLWRYFHSGNQGKIIQNFCFLLPSYRFCFTGSRSEANLIQCMVIY